jgi:hypothetical protein
MRRSKRSSLALVFAVLVSVLAAVVSQTTAHAAGPEMVPNGGLEIANGTTPASWRNDYWGSLRASFTYPTTGSHTGGRSVRVDVSRYTNGGAKWSFDPVTVAAGAQYNYSSWYKSNRTTEVLLVYRTSTGTTAYQWLADVTAS